MQDGESVRQVALLRHGGYPDRYVVTGPGHEHSEHSTLADTKAAAEASLT